MNCGAYLLYLSIIAVASVLTIKLLLACNMVSMGVIKGQLVPPAGASLNTLLYIWCLAPKPSSPDFKVSVFNVSVTYLHELFLLYFVFPKENGTYRYLIMCWICRRTSNWVSSYSHIYHHRHLGLTSQGEQYQPVDHKDWPENRHVEDRKEGAYEANNNGSGCGVPEFELRETPNKWAEFLVLLGRETARCTILHFIVYDLVARVEFWLEEGEKEIQEVDA